jgi:hypothetical protein
MIVSKRASGSGTVYHWSLGSSGSASVGSQSQYIYIQGGPGTQALGGSPLSWQAVTVRYTSAASSDAYINAGAAVNFNVTATYAADAGSFQLAARAGAEFGNIDIAEVMIWDRALTAAQLASMQGYVSARFPTLGSFGAPVLIDSAPSRGPVWANRASKSVQFQAARGAAAERTIVAGDALDRLFNGTALSIEAILQPDNVVSTDNVVLKDAGTTDLIFARNGTSHRIILFAADGSNVTAPGPPNSVQAGVPYHALGTWDGANITTYVNGVAGTPLAKATALRNSVSDFLLGGTGGTGIGNMDGNVGLVALYNRCLSAADALAHAQAAGFA